MTARGLGDHEVRERAIRALRRVQQLAANQLRVGRFTTPTTVLHARRDAVTTLALGEELAACGTHTRLRIVDTDAHLLTWTHLDHCLEAIL